MRRFVSRSSDALGVAVAALAGDLAADAPEAAYEADVTAVFGINQQIVTLEEARKNEPHALRTACRNLFAYTRSMKARV